MLSMVFPINYLILNSLGNATSQTVIPWRTLRLSDCVWGTVHHTACKTCDIWNDFPLLPSEDSPSLFFSSGTRLQGASGELNQATYHQECMSSCPEERPFYHSNWHHCRLSFCYEVQDAVNICISLLNLVNTPKSTGKKCFPQLQIWSAVSSISGFTLKGLWHSGVCEPQAQAEKHPAETANPPEKAHKCFWMQNQLPVPLPPTIANGEMNSSLKQ